MISSAPMMIAAPGRGNGPGPQMRSLSSVVSCVIVSPHWTCSADVLAGEDQEQRARGAQEQGEPQTTRAERFHRRLLPVSVPDHVARDVPRQYRLTNEAS